MIATGIHRIVSAARFSASAAALALLIPAAHADVLVLKNGERRTGLVKDNATYPDHIVFIDANGEVNVPRDRVLEIVKEPEAKSLLAIGNQLLEKSLFDDAIRYYREAQQRDPDSAEIKSRIQAAQAEIDRRNNIDKQTQSLAASEKLAEARKALEAKKYEAAQASLDQVAKLNPSGPQAEDLRGIQIALLMEWGKDRLDKLDKDGASEKFQAVRRLAPQHVEATNELIKLWRDNRSKTAELMTLLEAKFSDNAEDYATLKELADVAYREGQNQKALDLYLKLYDHADWRGTEVETRLQTLLERLRDDEASAGNFEKAVQYQKRLMELFPGADSRLLDIYDYRLRRAKLAPADAEGWNALAKWAREKEMDGEAREIYGRVLELDPKNAAALSAIGDYAMAAYANARDVFQQQNYILAKRLAMQVVRDFPKAEQAAKLSQVLSEESDIKIAELKRQTDEQAKRMLEAANSYYDQARSFHLQVTESRVQRDRAPAISNPRNDAIKYYNLAINAFEEAIQLGPTLPQVATGEAAVKLKDATTAKRTLENPYNLGFQRNSVDLRGQ